MFFFTGTQKSQKKKAYFLRLPSKGKAGKHLSVVEQGGEERSFPTGSHRQGLWKGPQAELQDAGRRGEQRGCRDWGRAQTLAGLKGFRWEPTLTTLTAVS